MKSPLQCAATLAILLLAGCNQPNYNAIANRLRETTIAQEQEIAALKEQVINRNATIQTLRERQGPALQTFPPERLAQLFTASSMAIRPETRTDSWTESNQPRTGFRVFIRFLTSDAQLLPAAGTMTIEAFELPVAPAEPRRIGSWTFSPADMKKCWYSGLGLEHFAFNCPFTTPPALREVVFKARFIDALSGQTLEATLNKTIDLPLP